MEALFGKKKRKPGGALVLYTTRHGATQRYAERIAQPLDALIKETGYARIDKAATYDAIVLGCCVYEGKLRGLDFFADNAQALAGKRLVLYTVGIGDPAEADVRGALDTQIRDALGELYDQVSVFHLRGAIRWRSLGLTEQLKMRAWMKKIRAAQDRTLTQQQMLEAEGGALDYSDEADLSPIIHAARFGKGAKS